MSRSLIHWAACLALFVAVLIATTGRAATPVHITVHPKPAQTFAGFGAGCGNWGRDYGKLTVAERQTLAKKLWRDLNMRCLRLWVNLDEVAPVAGECRIAEFRERYIDSGIIADAQANGVTDLLLAPDGMPTFMKDKRNGTPADFALRDDAIEPYAALIADFIAKVKQETGIVLTVTGVQNEPNDLDRISPDQMPRVVVAMRRTLDARGLPHVGIIAPESANVDAIYYETLDRLKGTPAAWAALAGVASHSYSMGATSQAARRAAEAKSYWMTEASDNGPESPGDAVRAASLASRFLGDVNHGVTHWIHFIGFEVDDPADNATRILAFAPAPLRITTYRKYDYYKRLSETFDVGAVFRHSSSDLDGDMAFTYGPKPRVSVAAARNPDASWAIGISNFTAAAFAEKPGDTGINNGYHARTFDVTISIPELADAGVIAFAAHRVRGDGKDIGEGETLSMVDGKLVVRDCRPLDLVTLRSKPAGR